MRLRLAVATASLLILPAMRVEAQSCDLVTSATSNYNNTGTPIATASLTMAVLACPGGKRISANEVATSEATGIFVLNKNVRYSDSEKILTADFGQYNKRTLVLQMTGNVVVTDVKTGSKLTAPALDYYQVSNTVKVARLITKNGRAHAVLKGDGKTPTASRTAAASKSPEDSTMVDADVIEVVGERTFHGTGTAVITRTDMRGYGNYVEYDQDRGDLLLAQAARIDGDKYRLQSDTIRAIASDDKQVHEVRASRNAILTSDEVRVESPFLRMYLDSGVVNRMVATRPVARDRQPVSLPRVLSKTFNVSADSIDALAPGQVLERVDAVGHAFGERIDTLPPPDVAKDMPEVLTNDWLRGDSLHATFIPNPDAKPDTSARNDRVLDRIIAAGRSASSAIRMKDPKDGTWKIYYTLANLITVDFAKGTVSRVGLQGDVHGVFLTPVKPSSTTTTSRPRDPGGRP
jgi:hypothetical protein